MKISVAFAFVFLVAVGCAPPLGEGEGEGEQLPDCPVDEQLGTLTLNPAFTRLDGSVALVPDTRFAVEGRALTGNLDVMSVSVGMTLFNALRPEDSGLIPDVDVFPSFLAQNSDFIAAGYRTVDGGGAVALFNLADGTLGYLDAPGVQAGALAFDHLFVAGSGLGTQTSGALALFAHPFDGSTDVIIADLTPASSALLFALTVAGSDVLIVGPRREVNTELKGFGPETVAAALAGTALDVAGAPTLLSGQVHGLQQFPTAGLVVVGADAADRGVDVAVLPLSLNGDSVEAGGDAIPVLEAATPCSNATVVMFAIGGGYASLVIALQDGETVHAIVVQ